VRKEIIAFALCALFIALCGSVEAQQPGKVFRIGFLDLSTASGSATLDVPMMFSFLLDNEIEYRAE